MKLPRRPLALASLALAVCLAPLHADQSNPPLLRGVLLDSSGDLFCLADATGAANWMKLGQTHEGWKLESFDEKRQILVVARGDDRRELTLETSRIKADDTAATVAEANALLDQMRFEDMLTKTIEVQHKAMVKSMSEAFGRHMSETEAARMAEIQTKAMKVMFEEMDIPGMRNDIAQAMSEVYTPEEIRAQSAFYSTSAGQSTLEKQPQLQMRLTELMMPRMMKAMPKMQAVVQEEMTKSRTPESAPDAR